ncbi:MAG: hypothetical protein ACREBE_25350, partial [bacterium]
SGTVAYAMDLARLMGIRRTERVLRVVIRPDMRIARTDVSLPVALERTVFRYTATGPDATVPGRTLLVYDSFFGKYPEMVAPFFADTTWLHVSDAITHPELADLLGEFDRVIFARAERSLYQGDDGKVLTRFAP